ncbi:MAG: sugar nucleotide-binding protein [Methylophilaceae bacterium]
MAKVLIVGCGDLGGEIARLMALSKHQVVGVRASAKSLGSDVQCIQADVTQEKTLTPLESLKPEIIIYCVAANAQTDESYNAHYVEGLRKVLATQVNNDALLHVFFVSSTRVYGQKSDAILDENTPAIPADFGGKRLLEAENLIKHLPCKATSMRLSGIYGKGRLYLVNMAKDTDRWPQVNAWSNRVHRDDAANFIAFLCGKVMSNQTVSDCYIVTDDMPTQQYEVLTWLAKKQGIDTTHIKVPLVHGGKRLSNQRMRDTGFQLRYPNYQIGYNEVLNNV